MSLCPAKVLLLLLFNAIVLWYKPTKPTDFVVCGECVVHARDSAC